jgi:hypothetical protein
VIGLEECKVAKRLTEEARKSLKPFGRKAESCGLIADRNIEPAAESKKPFVLPGALWHFHRLSNFPIRH